MTTTGDQRIDGILGSFGWADSIVYYTSPANSSIFSASYGAGEDAGFFAITAAMDAALDFALNAANGNPADNGFSVEGFTNLDLRLTNDSGAHIRASHTTLDPYDLDTVWAYGPQTFEESGDIWFTNEVFDYTSPVAGNYAHLTIMQAAGVALGLSNAQQSLPFGAVPAGFDHMEYTIMTLRSYQGAPTDSYSNETFGYAQTWMMQDIAALQHLYGADFTTNRGNTVYSWAPASGNTNINGAAAITPGANRIFATIWDGGGRDTYDLSAYATAVSIDLAPGGFSTFRTQQLANLGDGNIASGNIYNALQYQDDLRSIIENATGGGGNDTIAGNHIANILRGGLGNDAMSGLAGADRIFGDNGSDTIDGGVGNDNLFGGGGNDTVRGGDHSDTIYGNTGADALFGDAGHDTLNGGNGNDTIDGGTGNDTINGDGGADTINGGGGGDTIDGGAGRDTIRGGNAADIITGGAGGDILYGEFGNDTFRFVSVSDSPVGTLTDRIMDFVPGADRIDLSELSPSVFTLSIGGTFSGTGPSVITNEVSGDTRIFADVDGDGAADVRINVIGTLGLTAGDFIL